MVITLLETCGNYFDRGSSKRKLDRFLIHFQRYILSKGAVPLDIEFDLHADGVKENGEAHEEVAEDTDTDSGSDRNGPDGHYDEEELDEENHDETRDSEDEY
ncbi:hypothetical protein AgCh_035065 [Apium graveolens]